MSAQEGVARGAQEALREAEAELERVTEEKIVDGLMRAENIAAEAEAELTSHTQAAVEAERLAAEAEAQLASHRRRTEDTAKREAIANDAADKVREELAAIELRAVTAEEAVAARDAEVARMKSELQATQEATPQL